MAAQLPIAKIVALVIKTVAKPVSKRIQKNLSQYSITRSMLINIGQLSHNITSRLTILSAGYRVKSITPLEEPVALANGSEVFGETFLLTLSAGIVVFEYNRSKEKEKKKEEKIKQQHKEEKEALQTKLDLLDTRLKALEITYSDLKEELIEQKEKELSSLLNSVLTQSTRTTSSSSSIEDAILQQEEISKDTTTKKTSSSSWFRWWW